MAAAKKTAATKTAASSDVVVSTVSEDTTGGVPGISPELEEARDALRKREVDSGLKDKRGALLVAEPEVLIDPELVKQRDAALKAEQGK